MVQNILGNGIDIPLLGLREASLEVEGEYHEMFKDESYKIAQCFLLSTSQVKFLMTTFGGACTTNFYALDVKFSENVKKCTIKFFKHDLFSTLYYNRTSFFEFREFSIQDFQGV